MPFASIESGVHHYVEAGAKNNPAVVFANSLGTDLRIWDGVVERLQGAYRVLCYDKRGHGLSDAAAPPYAAADLALDVIQLLDFLKIERAVVCGVSVGGIIAQAMALDHPQRVGALVLCDTGARIGSVESWLQRIDTVQRGGIKPLENMTMERWFSRAFREHCPADVRGYANMLLQTNVDGYIGACCALRDADFRGDLERLTHPTLVLCGADDIATPPELGRELARLISGARFSLIDNAGHLPCIEQPETVTERIVQFFREVQIV